MATPTPSSKGTGQFVRQGHTTDGIYGSATDPKHLDGTEKPAQDLKP